MSASVRPSLNLDVLFYPDEERVGRYAHCLQLDLVEWGATDDEADEKLAATIKAHLEGVLEDDDLEHLYSPPPLEILRQFFSCKVSRPPRLIELEPVDDDGGPTVVRLQEAAAPCGA